MMLRTITFYDGVTRLAEETQKASVEEVLSELRANWPDAIDAGNDPIGILSDQTFEHHGIRVVVGYDGISEPFVIIQRDHVA